MNFAAAEGSVRIDPELDENTTPTQAKTRRAASPRRLTKAGPVVRTKNGQPALPTVIIDPSPFVRMGLRAMLEGTRFRVIASDASLSKLSEQALGKASLAVVGLSRDAAAELTEVASLMQQRGDLRVFVLGEKFSSEEVIAVIEAGASGYLIKHEIDAPALLDSLSLSLMGPLVVPRELINPRLSTSPSHPKPLYRRTGQAVLQPEPESPTDGIGRLGPSFHLSNREQAVLQKLTLGLSNKHIARSLDIAEATVKVHVKSLLRKIGATNRTQAAMWTTAQKVNMAAD